MTLSSTDEFCGKRVTLHHTGFSLPEVCMNTAIGWEPSFDRLAHCGVNRIGILIRIAPEMREQMLTQPHVRPMTFSGRTISSFVRVEPEGYRSDAALAKWVRMGVSFALAASRRKV